MNSRLVVANVVRPEEMVVVTAHEDMPMHPTGTAPRPVRGANALLPKIITCAGVGVTGEVPRSWPLASSASTSQSANAFLLTTGTRAPAAMRGAAYVNEVGLEPPISCHEATPVAPVQLGVRFVVPSGPAVTFSDGVGAGAGAASTPEPVPAAAVALSR